MQNDKVGLVISRSTLAKLDTIAQQRFGDNVAIGDAERARRIEQLMHEAVTDFAENECPPGFDHEDIPEQALPWRSMIVR